MSRQIDLTVQGVVGTTPVLSRASGRAFCRFRVAVTPSHREGRDWVDNPTVWFTAKAWGALAENLSLSLSKGDPVLLAGRFSQESWSNERGSGTSNVISLAAAGHDLSRGESRFGRRVSGRRAEAQAAAPAAPQVQAGDGQEAGWKEPVEVSRAEVDAATTSRVAEPTCERAAEPGEDRPEQSAPEALAPSVLSGSTWEVPVPDLEPALVL